MTEQAVLSFDRWSDLSARAKGLSTEELLDLLESEEVELADYLQAGPVHLMAIVAGIDSGDSALADAHVKRAHESASRIVSRHEAAPAAVADAQTLEPTAAQRAPALASPSYLLEVQMKAAPQVADPGAKPSVAAPQVEETCAMPMLSLADLIEPAIPFSGSTSPEAVAAMFQPGEPTARRPGVDATETALVPMGELVVPATGTFRDRLAPVVVPSLTLAEYADLRARLTVLGEEHGPTLKRFGVAPLEVRNTLKARFAELFQRDPTAQARFLAEMHAGIARVRAARER